MSVQRKVFRIEEHARPRLTATATDQAESAARHRQFMAELQSLRTLIGPAAPVERSVIERARAQIAEAQAYKSELDLIYDAIKRTRDEVGAVGGQAAAGERTARIGRELHAIVAGTERATQTILQAAEAIDRTAATLSAGLNNEHDRKRASDIRRGVVQIFEACNFQDLAGQRVANVVEALKFLEDHVARLMAVWQDVEEFKPLSFDDVDAGDRRYLNGPKLPEDPGHATQDDIDGMFGCA